MSSATDPLGLELYAAAQRMAEAHNTAVIAGGSGRWLAIHLSDGNSDGMIYDRRADAVRHQLHETQSAYIIVAPDFMQVAEAKSLLKTFRGAYDAGFRLEDPQEVIL